MMAYAVGTFSLRLLGVEEAEEGGGGWDEGAMVGGGVGGECTRLASGQREGGMPRW